MPRIKVEMKLIENHKKRKLTFKNRSDGLINKTKQIATLCGGEALCICCDPMTASGAVLADGGAVSVKTWPAEPEKVRKLIRRYRDMPADRFRQVLTPLTFNQEELKKEQSRVLKVQQCGAGKLGAWDSSFDDASVADLNSVLDKLDETMQKVQRRMVALGLVHYDMIVPASNAELASPMPHVMSLPGNNAFSFGGSFPDAGSMVPQYYDLPHDHMLAHPFPFQPPCHSYQMPSPYLSRQMPPPFLSYQMPPTPLLGPPEFGAAGYAANVVNGASAASEMYNDLMQGLDAGGAYVSEDVLEQAFSAGPPSAAYNLAHNATAGVWPGTKDNPMGGAAFQFPPMNDFDGPPGSASCRRSSSFQGWF